MKEAIGNFLIKEKNHIFILRLTMCCSKIGIVHLDFMDTFLKCNKWHSPKLNVTTCFTDVGILLRDYMRQNTF